MIHRAQVQAADAESTGARGPSTPAPAGLRRSLLRSWSPWPHSYRDRIAWRERLAPAACLDRPARRGGGSTWGAGRCCGSARPGGGSCSRPVCSGALAGPWRSRCSGASPGPGETSAGRRAKHSDVPAGLWCSSAWSPERWSPSSSPGGSSVAWSAGGSMATGAECAAKPCSRARMDTPGLASGDSTTGELPAGLAAAGEAPACSSGACAAAPAARSAPGVSGSDVRSTTSAYLCLRACVFICVCALWDTSYAMKAPHPSGMLVVGVSAGTCSAPLTRCTKRCAACLRTFAVASTAPTTLVSAACRCDGQEAPASAVLSRQARSDVGRQCIAKSCANLTPFLCTSAREFLTNAVMCWPIRLCPTSAHLCTHLHTLEKKQRHKHI
jgi:hypothetical protein